MAALLCMRSMLKVLLLPDQAGGRDELQEEQTEVPPEVFEQQPSALGGVQNTARSAWDAVGQVADKAKGLIVGDNRTEELRVTDLTF